MNEISVLSLSSKYVSFMLLCGKSRLPVSVPPAVSPCPSNNVHLNHRSCGRVFKNEKNLTHHIKMHHVAKSDSKKQAEKRKVSA